MLCIRRAARSDLGEILQLYTQTGLETGPPLPLADAEAIFERIERHPSYDVYVASRDGEIVGTFALLIMENLGHQGTPSAVIEDVAVASRLQAQGVGRELVGHALELARAAGCYKAVLSSNLRRSHAHAFYEVLGFERHGYSYRLELSTPLAHTAPSDTIMRQED